LSVSINRGCFSGRDAALAEIEKKGLHPRDGAMASGDLEDVHWHKTSLEIYVLEGTFETRDVASDTTLTAGEGDLIAIPARTLHAARCPIPARYVVGFESEHAMANFRPEKASDL
jgi:hypothetical protein